MKDTIECSTPCNKRESNHRRTVISPSPAAKRGCALTPYIPEPNILFKEKEAEALGITPTTREGKQPNRQVLAKTDV